MQNLHSLLCLVPIIFNYSQPDSAFNTEFASLLRSSCACLLDERHKFRECDQAVPIFIKQLERLEGTYRVFSSVRSSCSDVLLYYISSRHPLFEILSISIMFFLFIGSQEFLRWPIGTLINWSIGHIVILSYVICRMSKIRC